MQQEVAPDELVNQPEKLIVVCFISPQDTLLTAKVTLTRPILSSDNKSTEVTKATVKIAEGSRSVTLAYDAKNKYYKANARQFAIEAGKTYQITVTTPDGKKAESTCMVPQPVTVARVQFDSLTTNVTNANKRYYVQLRWQDPAGQKNYYRTTGLFRYVSRQNTSVIALQPVSFEGAYNMQALVTDNGLNGKILESGRGYLDTGGTLLPANDTFSKLYREATVTVSLLHTDVNYYQYHEAVQRQDATDGNPFAEPVLVTTNIQYGIGCFGAYNRSVVMLKLR
ncbi:hypothetical protein GCM10023189_35220 [Nibrella saemangeumensis]|uniref:DUF4249 domain-containing protein n=1 Tax=Nibrella saemangeumensis TaxID=1084526 RepID=A0ABP8N5C7_9BACT